MKIFGSTIDQSIFNEVESATSNTNVEDDWGVIMDICDKAGKSQELARNYLRAIIRRMCNNDPHIGLKAVTLLDACVKNSGKVFLLEVASREFENDFNKLMTKAHPIVAKKLRVSLKKWAKNEFNTDAQLNLIPTLYKKLRNLGYDFSSPETSVNTSNLSKKDANLVGTQEEEQQILKALELSLKETSSKYPHGQDSLYPSSSLSATAASPLYTMPLKEIRKVKALYDFEAAEDNELTFKSGEIFFVIDDADANWWKGRNYRGEGLFPASFVTADLSAEPEIYQKSSKVVQFKDTSEVKVIDDESIEVDINEEKIDMLLQLLHEADPTNLEGDSEEMLNLEREIDGMGPLVDTELENVDRKCAQLTQLSTDLVEALSLYHNLMRESHFTLPVDTVSYGYPPPFVQGFAPNVQPILLSNTGRPVGNETIPPFAIPQNMYKHFSHTNQISSPVHQEMLQNIPTQLQQENLSTVNYSTTGNTSFGVTLSSSHQENNESLENLK